jgi:hypothetical protein
MARFAGKFSPKGITMSGLGETNAVRTFRVGSRELTAPILEEILFRGFLAEPVVGKIAEETVILSSLGSRDYSSALSGKTDFKSPR